MLADDIAAALPGLRVEAERNMTDTCTITRAGTGKGPWNESTGQYDPPARVTVYGPSIAPHFGKCRLQIQSITNAASGSSSGDRTVTTQGDVLQLPVSETGHIVVNDVARMNVVVQDPDLVDHEFTVRGRHGKSQATSRRLPVEEVTG